MKKYKKGIVMLVIMIFTFLMISTSIAATGQRKSTGWERKGTVYKYKVKGKYIKNKIKKIKGKYYYFNKKGKRKTGWISYKKNRYYFDKKQGYAYTGIRKIGKNMYLFSANGKVVQKDGFYKKDGKFYYVQAGHLKKGFLTLSNTKYYFNEEFCMELGLTKIGKNTYYFDQNGKMVRNQYVSINGKDYYFDNHGCAKRNCWYNEQYFDNAGQIVKDAVRVEESSKGQVTVQELNRLNLYKCSKLMIVAHPDDEVFWGGAHLANGGYFVVCLTNKNTPIRAKEFYNVMRNTGNIGMILSYPDLIDEKRFIRSEWKTESASIVKDINTILKYKKWGLVVTHNPDGEYGHIHHKLTSKLVTQTFYRNNWGEELYYFGKYYTSQYLQENIDYISRLPEEKINQKKKLITIYKSQLNSVRLYSHMSVTEEWIRASEWS